MTIINESGLYSLILSSKLPTAKKFKHWVTSEVLPTLRKDGMYVIGEKQMSDDEMVLRVITLLNNKIKDKDKTIDYQQTIIETQQPKVFAYMTFLENQETVSVASAANLLSNSGFKIGRNELYEWLRRHHYVYKNSTKPIGKYVPKYFRESVENLLGNQETTTRITHKGLDMIYKKFVEENDIHQAPSLF